MNGSFPEFTQSGVYIAVFSGKLSSVMTQSEDQAPVGPPSKPVQGKEPAVVPAALNTLREVGGREGPEPTRFGDWELRGRCIDF